MLRRYLQLYWLKPFDAVNDAANAWALRQFPWRAPVAEIGGGDGVFSFVMHSGAFAFADDRYAQSDPCRTGDIYDFYDRRLRLTIRERAALRFRVGVDLKLSHVHKARETQLYDLVASAKPEDLPLRGGLFETVFLYTFHGLTDYRRSLAEARRILRPGGQLLMIALNDAVAQSFVCSPLAERFAKAGHAGAASYFERLDGGRYAEIIGFAHGLDEWRGLLADTGFRLAEVYNHVRPWVWRVYDTQTRPLLRPLIRLTRWLDAIGLRATVKALSVYGVLPLLLLEFWLGARPRRLAAEEPAEGVFLAFRAVPV